jgi:hypothetical protein
MAAVVELAGVVTSVPVPDPVPLTVLVSVIAGQQSKSYENSTSA